MNLNRRSTALCKPGPREGAWVARLAMLGLLVIMDGFEASVSLAAEATISARYRGEASGAFVDTTPPASFCSQWPGFCTGGMRTVGLPITYDKLVFKGAPTYLQDRFYIKLPGARVVDVISQTTGERYHLEFEIIAISQRAVVADGPPAPASSDVQGGCSYRQSQGALNWVDYLWMVSAPQNPTACHIAWQGNWQLPNPGPHPHRTDRMGIGYRLKALPPGKMKQGLYRGSLHYSVGDGADFDLGAGIQNLNSSSLTIHFELDVQHTFAIDFAPGSDRAVLEPPGGWLQWLNGGRAPQRLYRDLPFRLWSSGPFKVYKLCQYDVASHCGIRNQREDLVSVTVGLSLPGDIEHEGDQARRLTIPTGREKALPFEPVTPAHNRPGQLHFQVEREDVRDMLEHAGSTYQGQVTVVFDADV